jgi:SAM-dependent methyltransferase
MSEDPLMLYRAGRISGHVALSRLVLGGADLGQVAKTLPDPALRALLQAHWPAIARMREALAIDHSRPGSLGEIVAQWDRAGALAPEASVAAYCLGDPAALAAAAAEIVEWLQRHGLAGPARDVLDLGCGIGRVAGALAPRCRSVLGVDAAPRMVAEAESRHAAPNLRFAVTPGDGLAALPATSFDLVLATDVFPYLVLAGVAERHVADAARLLRPGGALVILNLSYRGDEAVDRADAIRWAAGYGFRLVVCGATPFTLWDGTGFVLERDARRSTTSPASAEISEPANTASFSSA